MPKSLKQYADQEKAREYRNHHRKQNYMNSREFATGDRTPYTEEECRRILDHYIPDRELARQLGRSVQAIQQKRNKLLRGGMTPFD